MDQTGHRRVSPTSEVSLAIVAVTINEVYSKLNRPIVVFGPSLAVNKLTNANRNRFMSAVFYDGDDDDDKDDGA